VARQACEHQLGPLLAASPIYETAAWGLTEQPNFLNQVVALNTQLAPLQVLAAAQSIELAGGRQREIHWGPRSLDIDYCFMGSWFLTMPYSVCLTLGWLSGVLSFNPWLILRQIWCIRSCKNIAVLLAALVKDEDEQEQQTRVWEQV
ncbi:MAG: 2-amino-4-hydroxy-6-hydroxymethyldihydropteridine diphosphokinase, partial [Lewinella sp.]|nr:2-amino-4-hydroxy-6-hydroxymethyldihydropteridine diphosphokinase [Lewinella sp.]